MKPDLATLPFADQLLAIDEALEARAQLPELLAGFGTLRDHEPLAYLVRRLAASSAAADRGIAQALRALFESLPDTGVHRVLRGLDRATVAPESLGAVVEAVAGAVRSLPLERLAAVCLMDRWLKNAAPETQRALSQEAERACAEAVTTGDVARLPDPLLLRLRGARLAELERLAESAGNLPRWRSRLEDFAARVLAILEAAPKSISQANAEELLSRRVYTDPGHFLVELLQNAEDARASSWRVEVGERAVAVWHDGTPFDARDVVGVLSIGQTTKQKGQIGFFGVGFKSVYEVCERPQIYSEPFRFEVADVSIPRRLAERPPGHPTGGTLLVLPLRDPADSLRSPAELHRRALALPARTLLTLANLKRLAVACGGNARTLRAEPCEEPGVVRLVHEESGAAERYLVESDRFAWPGAREASRASETPVLVALALDAGGSPVPLEADAPTVFSYLPTGERSGLRFLLHAHFDLPIDRERLDLESEWNRWAIGQAGVLLARLAARLAASHPERLDAFLDVLPLPAELGHPAYAAVLERFVDHARGLRFLRAASGRLLSPSEAAVPWRPSLSGALREVELLPGRHALAVVDERRRRAALAVGARAFGPADLAALLAREAAAFEEGSAAPRWLESGAREVFEALDEADDDALAMLRDRPAVPDQAGRLRSPSALARADAELRRVYGDARCLLAPGLDLPANPRLDSLWERLGIGRLGAADLVGDLEDAGIAASLLSSRERAGSLFGYLARQPIELTAALGLLPVFPDEEGRLCCLRGEHDAVASLCPEGPFGGFMRSIAGRRPALLAPVLESAHRAWLQRLGARVYDLGALLADLRAGRVELSNDDVLRLHRVLDQIHTDLPRRLGDELAAACIFPDATGELRPLVGEQRALLAADDDVVALAPQAPWLDDEIAALGYVRGLGVPAVGADAVARSLLGDGALDPAVFADLHGAYAYLARHRDLAADTRERLALASFWLDAKGDPRSLTELRRAPEEPELRALYEAWGAFPEIETGREDSAWTLAQALGLAARVQTPGYLTLLSDLASGVALDPSEPALRERLLTALREASHEVALSRLVQLARAPIFRGVDGRLHRVGGWDAEPDCCGRAFGALRDALAGGSRPVLCDEDERDFGSLLDLIGVRPATARDLVEAMESDPALEGPEAKSHGRRALVAMRAQLDASLGSRLARLPMWPTRDGRIVASTEVVRGSQLADALGEGWQEAIAGGGELLDKSAEADAKALAEWMAFRAPVDLLEARIRADARNGEPLAAQAPFLAEVSRVARLLAVVAGEGVERALGLPLSVDAGGRLVAGRLFAATAEEIELCRGLPLFDCLAEPAWAAQAAPLSPDFAPRLPARRIAQALAEAAPEPRALHGHPLLASPERRELVYRWLLTRAPEIERDDQARGVLGRACVIASAGGFGRSAPELLFDSDLPDLGIDWNPAAEVPERLAVWLARVFDVEEKRLATLGEHLLSRHEEAIAAGKVALSDEIIGFLARLAVREGEEMQALPRRLKLHRRLKVQADDGSFLRPRDLLAPSDDRWEMIAACCAEPPRRVASRYRGEAVRAFIHALGAEPELEPESLARLMRGEGLRPGPEASLALARYLAVRAAETPALRHELKLDRTAWIPDGRGVRRAPAELFWPEPELEVLVGERPDFVPHPELFHTVPEQVSRWLPFKRTAQLPLEVVAAHVLQLESAPPETLDWLELGLREGRLQPLEVRAALETRLRIADDTGAVRPARELVGEEVRELFAGRRGTWASGVRRYPRLAAALGIPARVGPAEALGFLQEIARDLERDGEGALIQAEPQLLDCLPRCLAVLGTSPELAEEKRFAITVEDASGQDSVRVVPDSSVVLPEPRDLARAASDADAPLFLALLPAEDPEVALRALRSAGVADLRGLWTPRIPRWLNEDITERHAMAANDLRAAIEDLWPLLPRLRATLRGPFPDWRPDPPRLEVRVVESLLVVGEIAGRSVTVEAEAVVDAEGGRLVVTLAELRSREAVAAELCRVWLSPRAQEPELRRVLAELLRCDSRERMQRLLDERGFQKAPSISEPERAEVAPDSPRRAAARKLPAPAPVVPRPREAPAKEPVKTLAKERGALDSLKRWLFGGDEGAQDRKPARAQPSEPLPRREVEERRPWTERPQPERERPEPEPERSRRTSQWQSAWMRPQTSIGPQAGAEGFLEGRAEKPSFGVAFAPSRLPLPYQYGPKLICERFDRRTQRWLPTGDAAAFPMEGRAGAQRVAFHGRIPAGQSTLPLPMYGRLERVEIGPNARLVTGRDGRPLVVAPDRTEVSYEISLDEAPWQPGEDAQVEVAAPEGLLEPTATDEDLPVEALDLVERCRLVAAPAARVQEIRAFIRERYRYDPSYLEDPSIGRWLERISRGHVNRHLAMLHAGRDSEHLGAGVCYELNVLACELLRRAGVPAAVCSGWTFDRGEVTAPDHLWAIALLPSDQGPRWLPVDAASTRDGRPLHAGARAPLSWRALLPKGSRSLPERAAWWQEGDKRGRRFGKLPPTAELVRVAHHVEELTGEKIASHEQLRRRCLALLEDPETARRLVELLRGR